MWNNCQIMILYIYKNSVYIRFEYVQFIFCIQLFNKNSFVPHDCDLSDCDIEIICIILWLPWFTLILLLVSINIWFCIQKNIHNSLLIIYLK